MLQEILPLKLLKLVWWCFKVCSWCRWHNWRCINNISDSKELVYLDNKEIRELAKSYLMILELRSSKNIILANKYTELNAKYQEQIKAYNNKGFFNKLF